MQTHHKRRISSFACGMLCFHNEDTIHDCVCFAFQRSQFLSLPSPFLGRIFFQKCLDDPNAGPNRTVSKLEIKKCRLEGCHCLCGIFDMNPRRNEFANILNNLVRIQIHNCVQTFCVRFFCQNFEFLFFYCGFVVLR